jgi:hypothetical protein
VVDGLSLLGRSRPQPLEGGNRPGCADSLHLAHGGKERTLSWQTPQFLIVIGLGLMALGMIAFATRSAMGL